MLKQHCIFLAISVLLILGSTSICQAIDTTAAKAAFQFLEESVSPRQVAMGGAATAMPGTGFCNYNPAQPYFSNDPSLSIAYSPMPGDAKGVLAEGFWSRSDMFFGLHLSNHSISGIIPSTDKGTNENIPFSGGFSLVSLVAGVKRERFSLAFAVNGMQDRIGIATAYGVSISAGAACHAIPGRLEVGLALLNEGTATGYTEETQKWGQGDRMPRSARLGTAYTDTIGRVPLTAALDIVYRDVGDKVQKVKGIAPRMTVPVGVEVWPTQYVAVRLGKRFNFETEIVNFGAGFRFRPLSFDMSFVIANLSGDIEVKPAFGLTYSPAPKRAAKTVITAPAAEVKPLQPPTPEQSTPLSDTSKDVKSPVGGESNPQPVTPAAPIQPNTAKDAQSPVGVEKTQTDSASTPVKNP